MYSVELKIVIRDDDKFLCHVYYYNDSWHAFVDLISERGRSWANGIGTTQTRAINDGIDKVYEIIDQ